MVRSPNVEAILNIRKTKIIRLHDVYVKICNECKPFSGQYISQLDLAEQDIQFALINYLAIASSIFSYVFTILNVMQHKDEQPVGYMQQDICEQFENQGISSFDHPRKFADAYKKIVRYLSAERVYTNDILDACKQLGSISEDLCNNFVFLLSKIAKTQEYEQNKPCAPYPISTERKCRITSYF